MRGHFRKKPVVIEAIDVKDALHCAGRSWADLPVWLREAYDAGKVIFASDAVFIETLEGQMCGSRDDWIIRGVQGELYPCKPDVFRATYELADGGAS